MADATSLIDRVKRYSDENDTDLLAYFGTVMRPYDDDLITMCRQRKQRRKNVLLMLMTHGGDPNAAYRMGRCLQVVYSPNSTEQVRLTGAQAKSHGTFTVLVNGVCKSAGTLLALSADRLLMTGNAELGPLDIQLRKPDEVGERTSGLTPIQAIQFLENQSLKLFKRHFRMLRFDDDLTFSTKMSAEIATNITKGLLSPIYEQIDPLRLAEVNRSLSITSEYADRLKRNLKENALVKLITEYPSHGFVIDREEAKNLFENVDKPGDDLFQIADDFRNLALEFLDRSDPFLSFLSMPPAQERDEHEPENPDGQDHGGSGQGDKEAGENDGV